VYAAPKRVVLERRGGGVCVLSKMMSVDTEQALQCRDDCSIRT
jgi:hypothetical protein